MTFIQNDGGITSAATLQMNTYSCNCIGPQPGYPKCPCGMRGLIQRNGRWIEPEKDLGPVSAVAAAAPKALKEQSDG